MRCRIRNRTSRLSSGSRTRKSSLSEWRRVRFSSRRLALRRSLSRTFRTSYRDAGLSLAFSNILGVFAVRRFFLAHILATWLTWTFTFCTPFFLSSRCKHRLIPNVLSNITVPLSLIWFRVYFRFEDGCEMSHQLVAFHPCLSGINSDAEAW